MALNSIIASWVEGRYPENRRPEVDALSSDALKTVVPAKAGTHRRRMMAFIYILASQKRGTLYIGVTRDLIRRVYEHKSGFVAGFTRQYAIKLLVWYQQCDSIITAIQREKQMKAWKRDWKIELIEKTNPYWHDLYPSILS